MAKSKFAACIVGSGLILGDNCFVFFCEVGEARGRVNERRRSTDRKYIAVRGGTACLIECLLGNCFAKPHDTRAQVAAAVGTHRDVCRFITQVQGAIRKTTVIKKVAVELNNLRAAGSPVQIVHVLSDQGQSWYKIGEFCNREVTRVWIGLRDIVAPPAIPAPDQFRVCEECFRCREIVWVVLGPEALPGSRERLERRFQRKPRRRSERKHDAHPGALR